jgi:hypothetical protein
MLLHVINTYHGTADSAGKTVHCYKAKCGAEIFSLLPFNQNQVITVGRPPNAQCAKCFKGGAPMKKNERPLHDGNLSHEVRDEFGNLAKTEVDESKMGVPAEGPSVQSLKVLGHTNTDPTEARPIRDDNGLGELEGGDFG